MKNKGSSRTKEFNATADTPHRTPRQILTLLINETYDQIPSTATIDETRKQLFLVHVDKNDIQLLYPDRPDEILSLLNSPTQYFNSYIAQSCKTGDSYCFLSPQTPYLGLLIINSASRLGLSNPDHQLTFFYDHELAHALIKNAYATTSPFNTNTRECIADAYAAIRHYQRFGPDTKTIQELSSARACSFVFYKAETHFTTPVLEKIIADSATMDYTTLTPQETMALANETAVSHALKPEQTARLAHDFNGLLKGKNKTKPEDLIKFVQGLLKTSSPQVLLYGSTALPALLSGQFPGFKKPLGLDHPDWENVRDRLTLRMEQFKEQGTVPGLNRLPRVKAYAP